MFYDAIKTGCGNYAVFSDGQYIKKIEYIGDNDEITVDINDIRETRQEIIEVKKQFAEYFEGSRENFTFKMKPDGTDFQKKVWNQLLEIPYGQTVSYGEIARRMGMETGSRAVGAAVGKNPVIIAIPCHRVIGKNGKLTGFSAGLELKKKLLQIESPLFGK